jgi:hypothetical protein
MDKELIAALFNAKVLFQIIGACISSDTYDWIPLEEVIPTYKKNIALLQSIEKELQENEKIPNSIEKQSLISLCSDGVRLLQEELEQKISEKVS